MSYVSFVSLVFYSQIVRTLGTCLYFNPSGACESEETVHTGVFSLARIPSVGFKYNLTSSLKTFIFSSLPLESFFFTTRCNTGTTSYSGTESWHKLRLYKLYNVNKITVLLYHCNVIYCDFAINDLVIIDLRQNLNSLEESLII